jgi:hypothetical protein
LIYKSKEANLKKEMPSVGLLDRLRILVLQNDSYSKLGQAHFVKSIPSGSKKYHSKNTIAGHGN